MGVGQVGQASEAGRGVVASPEGAKPQVAKKPGNIGRNSINSFDGKSVVRRRSEPGNPPPTLKDTPILKRSCSLPAENAKSHLEKVNEGIGKVFRQELQALSKDIANAARSRPKAEFTFESKKADLQNSKVSIKDNLVKAKALEKKAKGMLEQVSTLRKTSKKLSGNHNALADIKAVTKKTVDEARQLVSECNGELKLAEHNKESLRLFSSYKNSTLSLGGKMEKLRQEISQEGDLSDPVLQVNMRKEQKQKAKNIYSAADRLLSMVRFEEFSQSKIKFPGGTDYKLPELKEKLQSMMDEASNLVARAREKQFSSEANVRNIKRGLRDNKRNQAYAKKQSRHINANSNSATTNASEDVQLKSEKERMLESRNNRQSDIPLVVQQRRASREALRNNRRDGN